VASRDGKGGRGRGRAGTARSGSLPYSNYAAAMSERDGKAWCDGCDMLIEGPPGPTPRTKGSVDPPPNWWHVISLCTPCELRLKQLLGETRLRL
jgi:hypothetical protein